MHLTIEQVEKKLNVLELTTNTLNTQMSERHKTDMSHENRISALEKQKDIYLDKISASEKKIVHKLQKDLEAVKTDISTLRKNIQDRASASLRGVTQQLDTDAKREINKQKEDIKKLKKELSDLYDIMGENFEMPEPRRGPEGAMG